MTCTGSYQNRFVVEETMWLETCYWEDPNFDLDSPIVPILCKLFKIRNYLVQLICPKFETVNVTPRNLVGNVIFRWADSVQGCNVR